MLLTSLAECDDSTVEVVVMIVLLDVDSRINFTMIIIIVQIVQIVQIGFISISF